MKIPYFCCIGAELKRYAKDFDFMNQVYLYKVPTDDSIEEVLAEDYFKAISDSVLQDDILYIYEASAETLHSCRFDKQNGHITAIPLASDETLTGAVTTIIHDNLTKNRAVISNNDGKIAVSEVTSTELGYLHGATSNIQEQLNEKAKTDLSNLTSAGKNIGLWCNNAANIITEIPQDISIEISSGHILLKSGSKVYYPNGASVFDPYTATEDLDSGDVSGITTDYFFFINPTKTGIAGTQRTNCYSGATEPTGANGVVWYDTTNNVVKRHNGSSWVSGYSLPFCVYGQNLVKKHIFNGFGFIGYTVFALPGVKGLIPNYRNTDGTLKNALANTTTVQVYNVSTPANNYAYQLAYNGGIAPFYTHMSYDENDNVNLYANGTRAAWASIGYCSFSSGRISDFVIKQPFQAVDYNDTEFIAQQSAPSDKYIDLTLGNDGDTYKVPANGFVFLSKKSTAAGQLVFLINDTASKIRVYSVSTDSGQDIGSYIPVKKYDVVRIYYNVAGATNYFRFVYADGSK